MITSTTPVTPPGLIDRIERLVEACGTAANKNDKAIVAIELCIAEGVDTERHIVSCLMRAGFDNRHVGGTLKRNAGPTAAGFHWWLDADKRYHLHPPIAAGA